MIYWLFSVASKVNGFIGRKQKGVVFFFLPLMSNKGDFIPSVFGYRSGSIVIAGINLFPCICAHAVLEHQQYCIRM